MTEQDNLQSQSQNLESDHQRNMTALTQSQSAYDFSLPVWNAALLSWDHLKGVLTQYLDNIEPPTMDVPVTSAPL